MPEEILTRDEIKAMIYPIDTDAIRSEMERLMSKQRCRDFVNEAIQRADENAVPGNTLVAGGDILEIFDRVVGQGGVVRSGGPGSIPGANFATGSINAGNAMIQLGNFLPGTDVTADELKALYLKSDGRIALHETMHHAGELGYNDQEYAIVVSAMIGNDPPMPLSGDWFHYSQYWDRELRKRCR